MSKLVFTIDVEEWFHSENIAPKWKQQFSDHSSLPVMYELMEMLDRKKAKGTFFFLGVVAIANKQLVSEVAKRGHEIASHGWDHTLLTNMTRTELELDIFKSTSILEDLIGEKVIGYRSPCFSQSKYLVDILLENGYQYTSNGIRSTFHDRYSNNIMDDDRLKDFSLPVSSILNLSFPATGGGWFRLLPYALQSYLLNYAKQDPKVFYAHPVDFDVNLPQLKFLGTLTRWRQTVNVNTALKKLEYFSLSDEPLKSLVTPRC